MRSTLLFATLCTCFLLTSAIEAPARNGDQIQYWDTHGFTTGFLEGATKLSLRDTPGCLKHMFILLDGLYNMGLKYLSSNSMDDQGELNEMILITQRQCNFMTTAEGAMFFNFAYWMLDWYKQQNEAYSYLEFGLRGVEALSKLQDLSEIGYAMQCFGVHSDRFNVGYIFGKLAMIGLEFYFNWVSYLI